MQRKQYKLAQFQTYTREQVHDIFAPGTRFLPQTGTWGLHGIIRVPGRTADWVFFVTFGKSQARHTFEEHVSTEGILQWQSQPRQTLTDPIIKSWINHDPNTANIYLFLRTRRLGPYWYLGKLAYIGHDPRKERPVYFTWQILDWNPPGTIRSQLEFSETTQHQTLTTAIMIRRHFSYAQKYSEALIIASEMRRYPNTPQGLSRLADFANGTTLAIRWTDLAVLPVRRLLPNELKKSLLILRQAERSGYPTRIPEQLRSIAHDAKGSRRPVAATKIRYAEKLGVDYRRKLDFLRETQGRVTRILKDNFPEFTSVFRRWQTKGSLWVLDHYPSPTDILTRTAKEIESDLKLVTRGRTTVAKARQLYQAAERALVYRHGETDSFSSQLETALTEWREAKDAIESIHTLQNTIQEATPFQRLKSNRSPRSYQKIEPLRRTGGRYNTVARRSEMSEEGKTGRLELACRQYRGGWQVLLIAEGARQVEQNSTPLVRVDSNLWLLGGLATVTVDGRQASISDQLLIFRLSDTATGLRGRSVENISRDSIHLLIARQDLMIKGGEPVDVFDLAEYQAVLLGPNKGIHVLTADGRDLLNAQSPTLVHLELAGTPVKLSPPETPLFTGDFPTVTAEASEPITVIVGYEGTGNRTWRAQTEFDGSIGKLPDPPGKLGWFFVRFYDPRNVLLRGLAFHWVRKLYQVSWDAVHSELTLSHDSSLLVQTLSQDLTVDRPDPDVTRCRLPLGPPYDQTWWRITDREDVRDYIEVLIRVPRIQWALGSEDSRRDLQWTQEPLTLRPSTIKATSTQAVHIAVSTLKARGNSRLILWVGGHRLAPVRLDNGVATIPLRNLTSYLPATMERPLTLQFAVTSDHQMDAQTVLGQVKPMLTCNRCSRTFDSLLALQQHFEKEHPVLLTSASTYEAYYALAKKAGLADELPAKVYMCLRCRHIEIADNPYVSNPTSKMNQHFNQVHRDEATPPLSVVRDTAQIARLFDRVLDPLGECSACGAVLRADQPTEWNKHRDTHYTDWTVRN